MFVIVFNENNIVPDGQNNKLVYRFPSSTMLTDKYISISNISMYYSWFNITQLLGNNTFSYTWVSGTTTSTFTIIIPDGLYGIPEINGYIQFSFIKNGTYWITDTGLYAYPFEILLNASRYAVQLNTYLIPTSLPTGYTPPTAGLPTTTYNPQVSFPANFNKIVGYEAGFQSALNSANGYTPPSNPTQQQNYVSKDSVGTLSYLSSMAPNVQPNNSVLFSMSNINNPYTQPSSIIYSLNPQVLVGQQIYETPPNFMWNKMIDGTYTELRLSLLGNDLKPLIINDPNMTILCAIRDKNEFI
jgi:hypothetical protein